MTGFPVAGSTSTSAFPPDTIVMKPFLSTSHPRGTPSFPMAGMGLPSLVVNVLPVGPTSLPSLATLKPQGAPERLGAGTGLPAASSTGVPSAARRNPSGLVRQSMAELDEICLPSRPMRGRPSGQ